MSGQQPLQFIAFPIRHHEFLSDLLREPSVASEQANPDPAPPSPADSTPAPFATWDWVPILLGAVHTGDTYTSHRPKSIEPKLQAPGALSVLWSAGQFQNAEGGLRTYASDVEEVAPEKLGLWGLTNTRRLGHMGYMSAVAKRRIDPELKRQAEAALEEIRLKRRAASELFSKRIVKRRAIPFPFQADSPEDEVLSPAARRNELAEEF